MADPIDEQIIKKIATACATVTAANGYNTTVSQVYRPKTIGGINATPNNSETVQVMQGEKTRGTTDLIQATLISWSMEVDLYLLHRPSKDSTTPLGEVMSKFAADVTKAVMANPTWDGLAVQTDPVSESELLVLEKTVETHIVFAVEFRVAESDPYTQS